MTTVQSPFELPLKDSEEALEALESAGVGAAQCREHLIPQLISGETQQLMETVKEELEISIGLQDSKNVLGLLNLTSRLTSSAVHCVLPYALRDWTRHLRRFQDNSQIAGLLHGESRRAGFYEVSLTNLYLRSLQMAVDHNVAKHHGFYIVTEMLQHNLRPDEKTIGALMTLCWLDNCAQYAENARTLQSQYAVPWTAHSLTKYLQCWLQQRSPLATKTLLNQLVQGFLPANMLTPRSWAFLRRTRTDRSSQELLRVHLETIGLCAVAA